RSNFRQAPAVTLFSAEFRPQKRAYQIQGQLRSDDARAQAEHFHVVMFDALVRRITIVAKRSANAGKLVGRHGRPHAAAADEYRPLRLAFEYSAADGLRVIGIVVGLAGVVGAAVHHLMPQPFELGNDGLVEGNAGVVSAHGYLHAHPTPARLTFDSFHDVLSFRHHVIHGEAEVLQQVLI